MCEKAECSNEFCTSPVYAKGLCRRHYNRQPERRAMIARSNYKYRQTDAGKAAVSRANLKKYKKRDEQLARFVEAVTKGD